MHHYRSLVTAMNDECWLLEIDQLKNFGAGSRRSHWVELMIILTNFGWFRCKGFIDLIVSVLDDYLLCKIVVYYVSRTDHFVNIF